MPPKLPTPFDFINNEISRGFLDVQGLALVYNLKELPSDAVQSLLFLG